MARIALLRSIEIQQTDPYVRELAGPAAEAGLTLKLFHTDGECGPDDFPGESEKLPPGLSCEQIADRIAAWGADGVVSLSIPDENALRDAVVREKLAARGIPMVMHSPDATCVLANKWETKRLLAAHGLDTPDGLLVDGDLLRGRSVQAPAYQDLLLAQAERIGYPLLSKPLWDCLATGIRFLPDRAALRAYLADPYDGSTVLEHCVTGELCSVEVVGRPGHYALQPLIWKGPTGGAPSFVFDTVRYTAPRPGPDRDFRPVAERLLRLCEDLGIEGAIEVEMIHVDGGYQVIEINPRVSGSTTLSIAASGDNTYAALLSLLLGTWEQQAPGFGRRRRLALQLPIRRATPALTALLRERLDLVRASEFHIDGQAYANTVLTCEFDRRDELAATLRELTAEHGLLTPGVLDLAEQLLAAPAPLAAATA
ncbi:ATP-grasp domain-containing protein [Kitasatospora fiedleri]|uniref:ATP-grasp domain-containing protein n=1 Tax=Kitasatospora fiedleri TaxID=2991545 RepID=UPI000C2B6C1E|nr:ATP-grasp domain-containing protein [Kitasatospora fiedleri]